MKLQGIREAENCHFIQMSRRHLIFCYWGFHFNIDTQMLTLENSTERLRACSPVSIFVFISWSSAVKISMFFQELSNLD